LFIYFFIDARLIEWWAVHTCWKQDEYVMEYKYMYIYIQSETLAVTKTNQTINYTMRTAFYG